ncbi:hypothetical protein TNCV_3004201 [Trichonephila clavipes]|nr:hypothetical protein TNCV_3004201 [Trichonephila clavipes]
METFYRFDKKEFESDNGNRYAYVPVGKVHLKECYENLEFILNKLSFSDHKWAICGDLKVISMFRPTKVVTQSFQVSSVETTPKADVANQKGSYSWS